MLMNNKFKAWTLTGNPTGNYRCQLLVSHALNMSCSFSQSMCSIESRCVVREQTLQVTDTQSWQQTLHSIQIIVIHLSIIVLFIFSWDDFQKLTTLYASSEYILSVDFKKG